MKRLGKKREIEIVKRNDHLIKARGEKATYVTKHVERKLNNKNIRLL